MITGRSTVEALDNFSIAIIVHLILTNNFHYLFINNNFTLHFFNSKKIL